MSHVFCYSQRKFSDIKLSIYIYLIFKYFHRIFSKYTSGVVVYVIFTIPLLPLVILSSGLVQKKILDKSGTFLLSFSSHQDPLECQTNINNVPITVEAGSSWSYQDNISVISEEQQMIRNVSFDKLLLRSTKRDKNFDSKKRKRVCLGAKMITKNIFWRLLLKFLKHNFV